jgi:hypothetical protein
VLTDRIALAVVDMALAVAVVERDIAWGIAVERTVQDQAGRMTYSVRKTDRSKERRQVACSHSLESEEPLHHMLDPELPVDTDYIDIERVVVLAAADNHTKDNHYSAPVGYGE